MTILAKAIPKAIYRSNAIPIKRIMALFTKLGKKVLVCKEIQKTLKSQSDPEGKKKSTGRIGFPHLRIYYKASVIKTIWYWHKNRHINKRNRTENLEINPHTCGHLVHDKGGKNIPE